MTSELRDKIAIKIISGIINGIMSSGECKDITVLDGKEDEFAASAYKIADAMLRARKYNYTCNSIQEPNTIINNTTENDLQKNEENSFEIDCDYYPEY